MEVKVSDSKRKKMTKSSEYENGHAVYLTGNDANGTKLSFGGNVISARTTFNNETVAERNSWNLVGKMRKSGTRKSIGTLLGYYPCPLDGSRWVNKTIGTTIQLKCLDKTKILAPKRITTVTTYTTEITTNPTTGTAEIKTLPITTEATTTIGTVGTWGQWSAYSLCSASCNFGHKSRTRVCEGENCDETYNGEPCQKYYVCGNVHEQTCNTHNCGGMY